MPRRRPGEVPAGQSAVIGKNVRALRLGRGWTQAKLGELMGWTAVSTVCGAEGRRQDRQRKFTAGEIERLAAIFGVSPEQLNTRCVNCSGQPPAGFACLACGAASPDTAWRNCLGGNARRKAHHLRQGISDAGVARKPR